MKRIVKKVVTVKLDVERTKNNTIWCKNIESLYFIWGARTSPMDLKNFGHDVKEVSEGRGCYVIGLDTVRKRIEWLKRKIFRYKQALEALEELVK
jgi:hypothetical protein